jgi:alcohol dehydrogenase
MEEYWGEGKVTGRLLPMIAVPTTAGTGSETQSYALIANAKTHVKMACGDKRAAFRVALLDPSLTLTQPARVTALTGIDALSHAVESYVTTRRNPLSLAFSREAWRYLATNITRVLAEPGDIQARGAMQIGACLSGLAIENSMLGAAHAMANPLTATHGVVHGQAIAIALPHVVRLNGRQFDRRYQDLVSSTPEFFAGVDGSAAAEKLAAFITQVCRQAGLATTLKECGVPREDVPRLAAGASQQWTGKFNPVELSADDYRSLYEAAY